MFKQGLRIALFPFGIVTIGLLLYGCSDRLAGGAGAGNPPSGKVTLSLQANSKVVSALVKSSAQSLRNPDGTFSVKDSAGALLTLTGIEILVEKIEFSQLDTSGCSEKEGTCLEKDFSLNGQYKMDLVTNISVPEIGVLNIPVMVYKSVGLSPVPAEIVLGSTKPHYNFLINGKTNSISTPRSFSIELDLEEGLDFENPTGFHIVKDSLNKINLSLNVDAWLLGMNLSNCLDALTPDSLGLITVSQAGPCASSLGRVREAIQGSEEIKSEHQNEP